MSTKTSFKRIALVAASALAIAGFSAVPAHATNSTTGTMVLSSTTASTPLGTPVALTLTLGQTPSAAATVDTAGTATLAQVGAIPATLAGVITVGTATNAGTMTAPTTLIASIAPSGTSSASAVTATFTITFTPTVAGVYRYTLTPAAAGNTTAQNIVITAGYSANSTYANKAFPTQGSNITTGWAATAGGQATVRITGFADAKTYYVTTDTGSIISGTEGDTGATLSAIANTNGTNLAGGFNFLTATPTASDYMDVKVTDLGAATTTVSVKSFDATTGVASTFVTATVTWGVSATPSAQYSILDLNAAAGTTVDGTDATITTAANTAATKQFTVQVVVNDQYNVAYAGATLAASITGPGTLGIAATNAGAASAGRSLSVALTGVSVGSVAIWGDGTSGASTVTITATTAAGVTTTLGTKTVTFTGSPKTVTVTQNLKIAAAATRLGAVPATDAATNTEAGVSTTAAFTAKIVDSLGNAVAAGSTWKITSSDSTVITVGTCAEFTAGTAAPGKFECSVSGAAAAISGKSATVTFSVLNSTTGLYDIVATPLTFSVGGAIATVVITANDSSFSAGQAMALTATAKDSKGNAAYDGQDPYYTDATASKTVQGLTTAGSEIIGGVSTLEDTLYAPATVGEFIISGKTTDTAGTGTAFALTATVEGDATASLALDAANAATDAANNAYDEAQNATQAASDALAAVTALAAQVKSLIASVKKLTAAVAKLKK